VTGQEAVVEAINSVGGDGKRVLTAIKDLGYVCVPRSPTPEMLHAAWPDALGEDAEGVWSSMIEAEIGQPVSTGKSCSGRGL